MQGTWNNKKKPRNTFQKIREPTGNFSPRLGVLKNAQGTVLTEENDIKGDGKNTHKDCMKEIQMQQHGLMRFNTNKNQNHCYLKSGKALKDLTNRKSSGYDNIPIELFKAAGDAAAEMLTIICQRIWNTNTWPKDWKK